MYLVLVLIVSIYLEEVFSGRALSLRRGFWAREVSKFDVFTGFYSESTGASSFKMLFFALISDF